MNETKQYSCECIFCNLKCPECGSTDINLEFNVESELIKDREDSIWIDQFVNLLDLSCYDCDLYITKAWDDYERLELLEPIERALNMQYGDSVIFTYNKDTGQIEKQELGVDCKRIATQ